MKPLKISLKTPENRKFLAVCRIADPPLPSAEKVITS